MELGRHTFSADEIKAFAQAEIALCIVLAAAAGVVLPCSRSLWTLKYWSACCFGKAWSWMV